MNTTTRVPTVFVPTNAEIRHMGLFHWQFWLCWAKLCRADCVFITSSTVLRRAVVTWSPESALLDKLKYNVCILYSSLCRWKWRCSLQPSLVHLSQLNNYMKECLSYHVQHMWWSPKRAAQLPGENSDPEENKQHIKFKWCWSIIDHWLSIMSKCLNNISVFLKMLLVSV